MSDYQAPLKDMAFLLEQATRQTDLFSHPEMAEFDLDLVNAILEEAGKFASTVISPLNPVGDQQGCRFSDGIVSTPDGWRDAYQQFCESGWMGLALPAEFGGQSLPKFVAQPVNEMWLSASLSFIMFHALTQGCSEILLHMGSEEQKARYLEPLISGQWTVAMSLTEPGAGSDLGSLTTKAIPQADGQYLIKGQKIFITYGEHDMAENIVHLVLARKPDAPAGSRGISLFAVPKFRIEADGSLGEFNDVRCTGIEHKTGLHGSPTCSISYGDNDACYGELIGEENRGLMAMFILMNEARLSCGMQGVAFGERGFQRATQYCEERRQGSHYQTGEPSVLLNQHPDVQRMLLSIRSQTFALRSLGYLIAAQLDKATVSTDPAEVKQFNQQVALLTPIFKAFSTEQGNLMAGTTIQIFGGMGFVEETGVAQYMRDARITTIYEGTTGIQARDLLFRKVQSDQGAALIELLAQIRQSAEALTAADDSLAFAASQLHAGIAAVEACLPQMLDKQNADQLQLSTGALPLLEGLGILCSGWQLALSAANAHQQLQNDPEYFGNLIQLMRFYAVHSLPKVPALLMSFSHAADGVDQYLFKADL